MIRIASVFTSVLLLLAVSAHASGAREQDVQACRESAECTVIEGSCAGHYEAVNMRFADAQKEENRLTRMRIKCDAKLGENNIFGAGCAEGRCVLAQERY